MECRTIPPHAVEPTIGSNLNAQLCEEKPPAEEAALPAKTTAQPLSSRCGSCGKVDPTSRYFGNSYGIECEGSLLAAGELED